MRLHYRTQRAVNCCWQGYRSNFQGLSFSGRIMVTKVLSRNGWWNTWSGALNASRIWWNRKENMRNWYVSFSVTISTIKDTQKALNYYHGVGLLNAHLLGIFDSAVWARTMNYCPKPVRLGFILPAHDCCGNGLRFPLKLSFHMVSNSRELLSIGWPVMIGAIKYDGILNRNNWRKKHIFAPLWTLFGWNLFRCVSSEQQSNNCALVTYVMILLLTSPFSIWPALWSTLPTKTVILPLWC